MLGCVGRAGFIANRPRHPVGRDRAFSDFPDFSFSVRYLEIPMADPSRVSATEFGREVGRDYGSSPMGSFHGVIP
jgi:predicted ester cyclase